jgi:hypothetical protein
VVPVDETLLLEATLSGSANPVLIKQGEGILKLTAVISANIALDAGGLTINGTLSSPIIVPSGCTLRGTGTVTSPIIQTGGKLAVGNSPGIMTIAGDLNCQAGSIVEWELTANNNLDSNRGILYDGINVSGSVYINASVRLEISVYDLVDFTNIFWTSRRLWNMIQANGIIDRDFSVVRVLVNGVSQDWARTPTGGEFYTTLSTNPTRLMVYYISDPKVGGDPHITTIHGEMYTLDNVCKSMTMYDNGELLIDTQMMHMPLNYWGGEVCEIVKGSTYMSQTRIRINSNNNISNNPSNCSQIVLNNHNLDVVMHRKISYKFTDYNAESYHCYGKVIPKKEFRAKVLSLHTEKLGEVRLLFVVLSDKTIVNDLRFMANPKLFDVPATGALVSSEDVKWSNMFFYEQV